MTVADGFFFHYPELQFFWAWNLNHLSHPLMPFDAHSSMIFTKKILSFVQFFYIKNRLVIPCEKKIGDSFFFFGIEKNDHYFLSFWTKVNQNLDPPYGMNWLENPKYKRTILKKTKGELFSRSTFFLKSSLTHHLFDTYFNKIQNM